ncbi:MAG: MFS transporter [Propionibacteriaceae bacterium]|jgi:MFS family permease|nr:MFS transporter [Propionibacteriaceae bacterium]
MDQITSADPRRWRALGVCFAAGFVTMLDVSIVNVALPSIQQTLRAGPTELQLIVAGYSLAFGLCLVPAGRIGDARGRRFMFSLATAGFGLTSLLAGASQTDTQLSILRLLQGACAGMLNPQVSGLIQQLFRGAERARAFGLFGGVIGVSTALGPLLGGLSLTAFGPTTGWRWVFWINLPVCLTVLVLSRRLLPAPAAQAARSRLDPVGLTLIGLGTAAAMFPFVTTPQSGFWDQPERWWWLAGAVLLAPLAYLWERRYQARCGAAVLDPSLIGNVAFRFGAAVGLAYFAGFTSLFLIVSLMLQSGLGQTALVAGLVAVPNAIASGLSASLSSRLVTRFGRRLVVGGLALSLVGLLLVDNVIRLSPTAWLPWLLAGAMMVAGCGNGAVISPNQVLTFQDIPPQFGGVAGAVLQVGQRFGSAVGTAVVLAIYFTHLAVQTPRVGLAEAAKQAASRGLWVACGLIGVASLVALWDARRRTGSVGASPADSGPAT